MFILRFIAEKYVMLIELIGLILFLRAGVHLPKRMLRWTLAAMLLLLLDAVMIRLELWTQTFETLSVWRLILTYGIYLVQPLIMLVITQITTPMQKKHWWITLPWFISIPVYSSTQTTHFVNYYTQDNHYQGGLFSYYPYAIFGFYLAVFIVQGVIRMKSRDRAERLGILLIALSGVVGVLLFTLLDDSVSYDFSDIFTTAILLYYLLLYVLMTKTDPLTGLLNRQCYYRDMALRTRRIGAVASIDMNELKWINDSQGHGAGDAAIQAVADCLNAGTRQKRIYRVGGDEFAILYDSGNEDEVRADIAVMRGALEKTPYVCAFGCAMAAGGEIEEAMKRADREMYADKAALKQAVVDGGGALHGRK